MNVFTRLSNGWTISMNSFKVMKENKKLIIFPILSGISMLLIIGSFVVALFAKSGWDLENIRDQSNVEHYITLFIYYVVNYFVVVFFNTALVHCTRLYFEGEEVTVGAGLRFSVSRIGAIFSWALFAATVGTALRLLQENLGTLGKIITGLIGIVWSITTFFVVPVIAYENLGPLAAYKRSAQLMKEKWGESLGASFSFGLLQLLAILLLAIPSALLGYLVHPVAGILLFVLGIFSVIAVISATKVIFISAVYHNINGDPVKHFNQQLADNLFTEKKKNGFFNN
ncbi:MAG TPA: DUF6159 family protein [Puia sp.]|nr:DUF6159 family protein [Puia sp.]